MSPSTILDFINLFFAHILTGIEIVIRYRLRAAIEVLDEGFITYGDALYSQQELRML